MLKSKSRKKKSPKRVLALPDLEHAKTAVLNSLTSASGQRTYDQAIREFVAWYCSEPRLAFNRTVVLRYRIHPPDDRIGGALRSLSAHRAHDEQHPARRGDDARRQANVGRLPRLSHCRSGHAHERQGRAWARTPSGCKPRSATR